jgi:pSer/pThr/pTyr-binding forkhead associated (FHA) protein
MTESLRPRLVVLQADQVLEAREIGPGEEWTLGRGADATLPVPERSVSRKHARVFCDAAGVHLEDLGTPNGTYLDGTRVAGTVALRDGNLIRLGQSTNPDPILLRFEDAGSRLLEAMVTMPAPTPAPAEPPATAEEPTLVGPAEPEAGEGAEAAMPAAPTEADALAPAEPGVPEGEEEALPPPPTGTDSFEVVTPATRARAALGSLRGRLGWHAAVWAVALGLLVWGFAALLQSTQKPWQSVRVEPPRVRAGTRVSIRGVEVEPAESMRVLVDGEEATIEEMKLGEIIFVAPSLRTAEAGIRSAALRVERKGIVLLRQSLHYETTPEIATIEPREAAVGDTVVLVGHGFAAQASRVGVFVNQAPAAVVGSSLERIQFRVPVITREPTVEASVQVEIGEWSSAPVSLRVHARDAPCFEPVFEARNVANRVWEIRNPLGPVLYVEGRSAGENVPAGVERTLGRLNATFGRAASDPGVRFEVRESRLPALVAVGAAARKTEIARWSRRLDDYLSEQLPELRQTQLMPFWSAVVLNELLNVFAKKQSPGLLPVDHPAHQALDRLHRLNVDTGGQGCPTEAELATMTPAERDAFDGVLRKLPHRFGEVGGVWEGTFEDIFSENPNQTRLELRLELEQTGTTLKGRAFVFEVRGPGIRWSPPPIEGFEGRVRLGAETKVDLTVPAAPPYRFVRLSGVVANDTLTGTYRTDRKKEGTFQLVFQPGE